MLAKPFSGSTGLRRLFIEPDKKQTAGFALSSLQHDLSACHRVANVGLRDNGVVHPNIDNL